VEGLELSNGWCVHVCLVCLIIGASLPPHTHPTHSTPHTPHIHANTHTHTHTHTHLHASTASRQDKRDTKSHSELAL
jgi:hypothetical protein